jgi:hypothetical protein
VRSKNALVSVAEKTCLRSLNSKLGRLLQIIILPLRADSLARTRLDFRMWETFINLNTERRQLEDDYRLTLITFYQNLQINCM